MYASMRVTHNKKKKEQPALCKHNKASSSVERHLAQLLLSSLVTTGH